MPTGLMRLSNRLSFSHVVVYLAAKFRDWDCLNEITMTILDHTTFQINSYCGSYFDSVTILSKLGAKWCLNNNK